MPDPTADVPSGRKPKSPQSGGRLAVVCFGICLIGVGAVYARKVAIETGAVGPVTQSTPTLAPAPGTSSTTPEPAGEPTLVPGTAPPGSGQAPGSSGSTGLPAEAGTSDPSPSQTEVIPEAPSRKPGTMMPGGPIGGKVNLKGTVVGISTDGKAFKIHVSGTVSGLSNGDGGVVVSFFNPDKTPMPTRDPTSAGGDQMRISMPLHITGDPTAVDMYMDAPLEQFTAMMGVTYRCSVVIGGKALGESEPFPLVSSLQATKPSDSAGKQDNSQQN